MKRFDYLLSGAERRADSYRPNDMSGVSFSECSTVC